MHNILQTLKSYADKDLISTYVVSEYNEESGKPKSL